MSSNLYMCYFRLVYFNLSKEKFIIIFTFLPKVKDRYKSYPKKKTYTFIYKIQMHYVQSTILHMLKWNI